MTDNPGKFLPPWRLITYFTFYYYPYSTVQNTVNEYSIQVVGKNKKKWFINQYHYYVISRITIIINSISTIDYEKTSVVMFRNYEFVMDGSTEEDILKLTIIVEYAR